MKWKRPIFALVTVVLAFAAVEVALWIGGVAPLWALRDPFRGFSERMPVFELDESAGLWRTPPRATAHSFNYGQFAAAKPEGGYRLFVLGGSSAHGFPWGGEAAFTRLLGEALRASWPGRPIEAINAAAMSYGSHRLRILVHELARHAPDLIVVYEGHNEFVERRFYDELRRRNEGLDPLRELLNRSRLYTAMTVLYERARGEEAGAGDARTTGELLGLDVDREYTVDLARVERAEVRERFEENLRAIVRVARGAGARVILCTVASNLRDWAPNQSRFDDGVPFEKRQLVLQGIEAARQGLARGEAAAAVQALGAAVAVDPTYAEPRFLLGRAYEALGRWDDAREAYVAARDLDAQPARASSELNETIRRVARAEGALLVDVERLFEQQSEHGLVGFNLVEDYVHPKPEGHRLIARELWRTIHLEGLAGEARQPDVAEFDRALDALGATADAARREANPSWLFNLAVVLEKQGLDEQAMEKYRACLRLDPRYHVAHFNLGRLLFRRGRFAEAAAEQRSALALVPDDVRAMIGLGEALRRMDRPVEAEQVLRRAIELDRSSHEAWGSLGGVLTQLGRLPDAEQAFRTAVALDPRDAGARTDLGYTLLFQGDIPGAEAALREALGLRPDDLRARNGMAAVYTEQGRLDEAERLFRENLNADPDDPFARGGLLKVKERRSAGAAGF